MGDLISRQKAIEALKHNQDVYSHNFHDDPIDKYTAAIIAADIDSLINLPSAQSEQRKKGKWKGYNTDKEGWKRTDGSPVFMTCSECFGTVLNNGSAHWNFCPSCGANMRGDKDDIE